MNPRMKKVLMYFDVLFFMLLGLLGCFMLFMWFGTEHQVCSYNRNIFWAFPLHVLFAFLIPRGSDRTIRYARYATWLLIASMFYSFFAIQPYIPEITPILIIILIRLNKYSKPGEMTSFRFRQFTGNRS